jgi:hypothetical protein
MPAPLTSRQAIADEILRQTTALGTDRSICPSEVARALDPDWRRLMSPVRRAAAELATSTSCARASPFRRTRCAG